MRLLPRMMFEDFFDDMFDEPMIRQNSMNAMRCDIHEKEENYLLDIELPGYRKEDIEMAVDNGYLTVSAARNNESEEKNDKGEVIRQERIQGTCSRSFYVGDTVDVDHIQAHYDNGVLKITLPKIQEALPEPKKTVMIE